VLNNIFPTDKLNVTVTFNEKIFFLTVDTGTGNIYAYLSVLWLRFFPSF
jgi:hypothetical protein